MCMVGMFSGMVEKIVEVFMDDFSVFGDSFDDCLENLESVLVRCEEKSMILNWKKKCQFMVIKGIVLGNIVYAKQMRSTRQKLS